jgi:hypothetical protein
MKEKPVVDLIARICRKYHRFDRFVLSSIHIDNRWKSADCCRNLSISQGCTEISICLIVCSTNNVNNNNSNNMWVTTILKCLLSINSTAAPSCNATPPANLLEQSPPPPNAWTFYAYNYTANSTSPTLMFGFKGYYPMDYNYLDSVSVVDNSAPSIQLLTNPGFDNSTSSPIGWATWCQSACVSGAGQLNTSSCYSGNCYVDHCQNNYDYVAQSFSATIGHIYKISFWLMQKGGSHCIIYVNVASWRVPSQLQQRDRQI